MVEAQAGPEAPAHRRTAWWLFVLLVVLSTRLLVSAIRRHVLLTDESPLLYHAATLGFNYFDFGFIRRGLGGSIVHLLGGNLLQATAVFHVLSAACVAAVACWLFARLQRPLPMSAPRTRQAESAPQGGQGNLGAARRFLERAAFALLLIALMMRWAEDPGRTDMAVAALIGLAAIEVQRGRPVLACLAVAIGLAVHETSFVFGIPLLVGLYLDQGRWRRISKGSAAGAVALLLAAFAVYQFTDRLPHASVQTMVDTVRSRLPRHEYVDWAIYFAISGARGVRTSICQNFNDPNWWLHLLTGLLVIALFIVILRTRRSPAWLATLLVSVPPFLFLGVVANDMSRWAVLAAFNVWLLCAVSSATPSTGGSRPWLRLALAALVVPLIHPKTARIDDPIFAPTPVIERIALELGGPPTPRFATALAHCDPGWRSVLGDGDARDAGAAAPK